MKLDHYLSFHCLRHTYASIHISLGTSIAYLQRQLGHASIAMTVDIYGSWLNDSDMAAADKLDRLDEIARGVDEEK